ncbi:GAF domain-containing sensor histidine kinase [Candidatus Parcubacteria bacterium]|nr:GAF domain-containing sensor histidine kinase [Candidatus Parcubacteria bacterium]
MQLKYLFFGYLFFLIASYITNLVLPVFFKIYFFNGLGPALSLIFSGFIFYIITRYSFLDIKLIVQRGIIYSTILGIIIGFYIFLVFALGFFFQQSTDATIILAAGIATVFGIYGVPYLERYFQRITDRIFFKDKYDYSQAIYELSEILNKNIELNQLLIKTVKKLKDIFKVSLVTIILPDQQLIFNSDGKIRAPRARLSDSMISAIEKSTEILLIREKIPETINKLTLAGASREIIKAARQGYEIANKYGFEAYLAIKLKNKLIGFVVLTKKLSGDFFNAEDVKLLKTFSNQAAVAMEKAKLFGQVKAHSEKLEEKVRERTAKISGLQENQKKMMQEMAHSLQTPITILKAELSQLGRDTRMEKKFRLIERSIDRVSNFIYDILRLSRLESGGKDFSKEIFSLSEFLIELIESYEIIASEKNISIKSGIEKNIFFNGNKKEIEEMIMNIVSNSVKYFGGEKNNKINFTLKKKGGIAEIIIADTGIGIKKEKIPKLFSRFYRAGKDNRGTGLGLAICKEIINRHKGEIRVESEDGEGTKFIIQLPLTSNENKDGKI